MKTPTLEEVKEYFKNAKEVKSLRYENFILTDVNNIFYYEYTAGYYILDNIKDTNYSLWRNGKYAEIISYKDEGVNDGVNINIEGVNTPKHYDNSKGSLYQFCENQQLNSYEFEIIKRVVRCRKKGEFISDIEKTIKVLQIYLQEQGEKYSGQIEKLNKYEK